MLNDDIKLGYDDCARLWYKRLGMHTFKYPSLHEWQVQLSVKIHLKCQDIFGIVATGAGKSTLIHLPVVADMALGRKTISLVTIPQGHYQHQEMMSGAP